MADAFRKELAPPTYNETVNPFQYHQPVVPSAPQTIMMNQPISQPQPSYPTQPQAQQQMVYCITSYPVTQQRVQLVRRRPNRIINSPLAWFIFFFFIALYIGVIFMSNTVYT